jgi:hypothetical protein
MPGLLVFSLRLLVELLLVPVRALRRALVGDERAAGGAREYAAEPERAPPSPPAAEAPSRPARPRRAPTRRRRPARAQSAEPIGAEVAEMAEPAPATAAPPEPGSDAEPPRSAEPTRGEVAEMREAAREAETGGADSVGADVHVAAPWPGYDEMPLDQVLARLEEASDVELAVVRAYERSHEARQAVLLAAGEAP